MHNPHPESAREFSQTSCPQPRSLIDMPFAWLRLLLLALCPPDETFADWREKQEHRVRLRPLLQTCTALRDLVLSERRVILDFELPIASDHAPAAQDKLALGCRRSAKVHLNVRTEEDEPMTGTESSATGLLLGAMEAVGKGLEAITSIKLKHLEINAVVPAWLGLTCPNMTSLTLEGCRIRLTAAVIPAQCHQLTTLGICFPHDEPGEQPTALSDWQHHLQALAGLTSLLIYTDQHTPWFVECCSVVGAHLTQLGWSYDAPAAELVHLPVWHPCLVKLELIYTTVDDQGMEALLSMQRLQVLHCVGFNLQHSYTHRTCNWKRLGFNTLSISDFDRLPLGGVQSLEGGDGDMTCIIPSPDLGAADRVAAALAKCGGIRTEWLDLANYHYQATSPALEAAMAVATQYRASKFELSGVKPVTPGLLAAIKQHLPVVAAGLVRFCESTYNPDVWPLLLPSLPPATREVQFLSYDQATDVTEDQATSMCVHASWPVRLTVINRWGRWQAGWEERVQAAMAAAGHQHVQLSGKLSM